MSRDAASAGGDRTELSQQFYREYKEDLLYAAGLDSRPLEAGDQAAIERLHCLGLDTQAAVDVG